MKLNERQRSGLAIVGFGLLMVLMLVSVWACAPRDDEIVALGVTHFSGLDVTGTETDLLVVDQTSTGDIVELRDNGTVVWRVADGGAVTQSGATDLSGNLSSSTGAITVTDNVMVDGAADAVQLTVQGYTTQTNNILVVEQSDGTDKLTVDNSGNLVVVGTSDLQGNVSSSVGVITATDNVMVDGAADAVQLTVQGYTTQTNDILVVEQSDGTDKVQIDNSGVITSAGGLVISSGGANVTGSVDGSADVDIGTWLNFSAQSTLAVSADGTITPTGTYQPITSTAAITCSATTCIANGGETGDVLILRNGNAADVIKIDGTGGNVECKADVDLGAGDTLTLIWNGSDWNCLANYDNS